MPRCLSSVLTSFLLAASSGASLPWDTPVNILVDNLTGPLAKAGILAAAAIAAYTWMFSEQPNHIKTISKFIFGGALLILGADFLAALGLNGALV
jgi:type IV secretion system protein VirB2